MWTGGRRRTICALPPSAALTADVTRLLQADDARGDLYGAVYDELQGLARAALRRESDAATLATRDLVHEAYVRLDGLDRIAWRDRSHFFSVAAGVMRRVLVDWARARRAEKRGGGSRPAPLDAAGEAPSPDRPEVLLALDEALARLASRSERQARVVECRYFAGLTIEETAAALGVSPTTVKHDWALAQAWLYREVGPTDPRHGP